MKYFLCFLLFLTILSVGCSSQPNSWVKVAAKVNQSICLIKVYDPLTNKFLGNGTGFLLNNDFTVMTAKHVVNDLNAHYDITFPDGMTYRAVKEIQNPKDDIGYLIIDRRSMNRHYAYLRLAPKAPVIGQYVAFSGYPLQSWDSPTFHTGMVAQIGYDYMRLPRTIVDANGIFGFSGSPLVDDEGRVLGVMDEIQMINYGDSILQVPGQTYFATWDSLKRFISTVRQ